MPGKHSQSTWVLVQLPTKKMRWYQLPKDVCFAMQQHVEVELEEKGDWYKILLGKVINLPTSSYGPNGEVSLSCGRIVSVKRSKKTHNPKRITRSQFANCRSWRDIFHAYHFLRHDYGAKNRANIFWALVRLNPLPAWLRYGLVVVITALILKCLGEY